MKKENETNVAIIKDEFPSNSKAKKVSKTDEEARFEDRKVEKVVSGKVIKKKKSVGKRAVETFFGDDFESVKDFVIQDVLIQAAKSMICDMVGWGGAAEMLLFGDKRGGSRYYRGRDTKQTSHRVNYGSYSSTSTNDRTRDARREMSRTSKTRHDFDEIVLETRGEAEEVLERLVDLTIDYDFASVADLYDLVGITPEFTDDKWGWADLSTASVGRVRGSRGGYIINLPRTQPLD